MEPIANDQITPEFHVGAFHERQRAAGATFYEDYGSLWTRSFGDPVAEYWAIRRGVALWDVYALVKFRFTGRDVLPALDRLTSRRVSAAPPGTVLYSVILNDEGLMLDEATILVVSETEAYLFGNDEQEGFCEHLDRTFGEMDVSWENVSHVIPNVAVQGPDSYSLLSGLVDQGFSDLGWFRFLPEPVSVAGVRCLLVRAGFTSELGYELYLLDGDEGAVKVWDAIAGAGATPIGLDAIELARIEAGLVIAEEDYWPAATNPYDLNLDRFIDLSDDRDFVGREAAERSARAPGNRFVTLEFGEGAGPAEAGQQVTVAGAQVGDVRSAAVTPRFGSIALAVVATAHASPGSVVEVEGRRATVRPVPIDDPAKSRPRSDPLKPQRA